MTALRRRLIPYGLLGPGILWLILFFVVPMYFMGAAVARDRDLPRISVRLALRELHGRAERLRHAVHQGVRVLGGGDGDRAC